MLPPDSPPHRAEASPPPHPGLMRPWRAGGLDLLSFPGLDALGVLRQAVTTRHGGVSAPPHDTLNLAQGDDRPEAVAENLDRVKRALGLKRLAWVRQVHGDRILQVPPGADGPVGEADGLATDQAGVGLMIKQADCQAVILVEPEQGVLALLHVGWRGNVADMPGKGVAWLAQRFGVEPAGLHAAVSPGLGPCCAEFTNHARELGPSFLPYRVGENHFDLPAVTRDQLIAAGVRPGRIELSGLCTRCDPRFFSYRREGQTGRFATLAVLK